MTKLYEIALVDESKIMINLEHIESVKNGDKGFITVTMASGTEMDVVPQTLTMALAHAQCETYHLTDKEPEAPVEEPAKEVEGELVD